MEFWKRSGGIKGWLAVFTAMCCALLLTACGGGGGSAGTTSGTSGGITAMAIQLVDPNGNLSQSVTNATPILARARFTRSGQPISGQVVTFATTGAKVTMAPVSGSVLTDASGVATVTLVPTDPNYQSGDAGSIVATASAGGVTYTATANYQLGVRNTTINLVSPSTNPVSISAYGTTEIVADVFVNGILYTTQPVNVSFNSFCVSQGKATLAGVVRTINGRARALYTDNGCGQEDLVTVTVSGSAAPATLRVATAPPSAGTIRFTSVDNRTIAIKGTGSGTRPETAKLTFTVLDTNGNPFANKQVNFSVFPADVTLASTTGFTDATGKVTVVVNSGTVPTTFRVTATIPGGPSVVSDSLSASTGAAAQAAMSLSAEKFQISGWNHDNETTNINVLLADAFGNPIADGALVNFVTDSGAVGTSSGGNCTTTNGGCSVVFRSQDPRYGVGNTAGKRAGLATITATTSSDAIISGKIGIFLSTDFASNVFYNGTRASQTGANPLPAVAACQNDRTASVTVEVNDDNFNPMPIDTKLEIKNAAGGITVGAAFPDKVGQKAPDTLIVENMAARQGTQHQIPISITTGCDSNLPTKTATGSFTLLITSPKNGAAAYTFTLNYLTN